MGRRLVNASYDATQLLSLPSNFTNSPVAIVYLDLDSYLREKQNPDEPWARALHAKLVNRLSKAGAKAVVFDIIFDQARPDDPEDDRAFADAMHRFGKVVLAAEINRSSRGAVGVEGVESHQLTMPASVFSSAAAAWGIASFLPDDDFVVRRHFEGYAGTEQPALALATAKLCGIQKEKKAATPWIRYYGGPLTIPHVSYSAALHPAEVPDEFFRGKIILVGARPMAGTFQQFRDEFRSPLTFFNPENLFMPAVEIHATELINLARGDSLYRQSVQTEALILFLSAVLSTLGIFFLRPWVAWIFALTAELATIGGMGFVLPGQGIWFPWMIIAAVQIPGALGGSILYQSLAWYRQRRSLEAQRRADEAKIREQASLIDKAQDAIVLVDLEGGVTFANPSARQLYGWDLNGKVRENGARDIFPVKREQFEQARHVAIAQGEWLGEMEQKAHDGRKINAASRCTLIRDDRGNAKSLLFISTDITEKKRLEAEFYRAQRMESIGALAGGMAHDLNNALSPILMGLQLLQKEQQDEETRRMLTVMEDNTHRGADMVRQVLLFSRGREEDREILSPANLIRDVERMTSQMFPKSIRLATMVPADLWPITGNATQLHQVLLNLCVNARDAMPGGGDITLAADNVELTADEARPIPGARAGQFILLVVSDTGMGIPPDVLPRIFEPFFTTKPVGKGTGLGLSTVARIVKQHGGFIHLRSELGRGTTFDIYLPARQLPGAQTDRVAKAETEFPRGEGETILVADDEQSVREMITLALTAQGYRVITAANGAEALALLEQHTAAIRLALLDIDMPVLSGLDARAALRQKSPTLPVVMMTGDAPEAFIAEDGERLAKPFQLRALLSLVSKRLSNR